MYKYSLLVAMGSFLSSLACSGGDWAQAPRDESAAESETGADEVAVPSAGPASEGAGLAPRADVVLGQAQQAVIDDSCFDAVPPFVQAGDFFRLSFTDVRPISTCQGGQARFIMVDNLVKDLGIPAARPNETPVENCADLQIFFAVGLYGDPGDDAQVIARGSKRGEVVVRDDGTLFCDVTVRMQPNDLDDMPDGRDYIFVVQALDDDRQNDFSEDVLLFTGF